MKIKMIDISGGNYEPQDSQDAREAPQLLAEQDALLEHQIHVTPPRVHNAGA